MISIRIIDLQGVGYDTMPPKYATAHVIAILFQKLFVFNYIIKQFKKLIKQRKFFAKFSSSFCDIPYRYDVVK